MRKGDKENLVPWLARIFLILIFIYFLTSLKNFGMMIEISYLDFRIYTHVACVQSSIIIKKFLWPSTVVMEKGSIISRRISSKGNLKKWRSIGKAPFFYLAKGQKIHWKSGFIILEIILFKNCILEMKGWPNLLC